MNRAFTAAVLTSLLATSALAAPLPAGKPAGVQNANMAGSAMLWVGFAAIIAVTVAVVASDNNGGGTTTTATGTP